MILNLTSERRYPAFLCKVFHKQLFDKLLKTLCLDTIETIQAAVQKMEIKMEKSGFVSFDFSLNYFKIIIAFCL